MSSCSATLGVQRVNPGRHLDGRLRRLADVGAQARSDRRAGAEQHQSGARFRRDRRAAARQIANIQQHGLAEFIRTGAPQSALGGTLDRRPWVLDSITMMNFTVSAEANAATLEAMAVKPDDTATLATIDVPTLITSGSDDIFIPKTAAGVLEAGHPGRTAAGHPGHRPRQQPRKPDGIQPGPRRFSDDASGRRRVTAASPSSHLQSIHFAQGYLEATDVRT